MKNVSDRPVLLSWPNGQGRGLYIARNDSAEGIIGYLSEGETTIALSSQTERVFPLLRPSTYPEIDPENMMELEIRWRFAQPIVRRTPRTLRLTILGHGSYIRPTPRVIHHYEPMTPEKARRGVTDSHPDDDERVVRDGKSYSIKQRGGRPHDWASEWSLLFASGRRTQSSTGKRSLMHWRQKSGVPKPLLFTARSRLACPC